MEAIDEIVMNRIANIDLKSYDFESDPDCSYSFTTQKLWKACEERYWHACMIDSDQSIIE